MSEDELELYIDKYITENSHRLDEISLKMIRTYLEDEIYHRSLAHIKPLIKELSEKVYKIHKSFDDLIKNQFISMKVTEEDYPQLRDNILEYFKDNEDYINEITPRMVMEYLERTYEYNVEDMKPTIKRITKEVFNSFIENEEDKFISSFGDINLSNNLEKDTGSLEKDISLSIKTESSTNIPKEMNEFMHKFCKADELLDKVLEYNSPSDLEDIYDITLTPHNYISFKGMKLMMIINPRWKELVKNRLRDLRFSGPGPHVPNDRWLVSEKDNEKVDEIIKSLNLYLINYGDNICKQLINEKYIVDSLNLSSYIFILTTPVTIEGTCKLSAFRFLKEPGKDVPMIFTKKDQGIQSILICALEESVQTTKKVVQENEMDDEEGIKNSRPAGIYSRAKKKRIEEVQNVILKAGFGQLITYHTLTYSQSIGKLYYYMSAASVPLLRLYRKWGFHLGIPELKLDNVIDNFPIRKKEMTEEVEKEFVEAVRNEILKILKYDKKLLGYIIGKNEEYAREISYKWGPVMYVQYIDKLLEKIFSVENNKFFMYFDLEEHETLYELRKTSSNKLKEYYQALDPIKNLNFPFKTKEFNFVF
jgi:hypothetical protein